MGHGHSKNGLGWKTTAEEAAAGVDLHGKNVIVTGGNSGIGVETARTFAKRGANVVIACRDVSKAEKTLADIRASAPDAHVEAQQLDLSSLASVREFAAQYKSRNIPLHILVNNAGVMGCPYQKTVDGFEMQFGTNHLGHFLLTNLLIDELIGGAPSRVVSVASEAHGQFGSGIHWTDLQWEKSYSPMAAYGQSKTANILFAIEFTKRFKDRGVVSNSLHPGEIKTNLSRHSGFLNFAVNAGYAIGLVKNVYQGAATSVYVATAPELATVGGKYFNNCNEAHAKPYATDPEAATRLWDISAELVGLGK